MFAEIIWFPTQASTTAQRGGQLFYFLVVVCGTVGLLVAVLLIYFAVRYRRRPGDVGRPPRCAARLPLELFWTHDAAGHLPGHVRLGGDRLFRRLSRARRRHGRSTSSASSGCGSFSIPRGSARSTSCTCPSASRVKLLLTSEDVIHSFFVPDFPRPHGRPARPLHLGLVPADASRARITCSARNTAAPTTPA